MGAENLPIRHLLEVLEAGYSVENVGNKAVLLVEAAGETEVPEDLVDSLVGVEVVIVNTMVERVDNLAEAARVVMALLVKLALQPGGAQDLAAEFSFLTEN